MAGQLWRVRTEFGRAPGKGSWSEGSRNRDWKLGHSFWAPFKSCWVRSQEGRFLPLFCCVKTVITVSVGGGGSGCDHPATLCGDKYLRHSLRVKTATLPSVLCGSTQAAGSQSLTLFLFSSRSNEKNGGVISVISHLIYQPPQQAGRLGQDSDVQPGPSHIALLRTDSPTGFK